MKAKSEVTYGQVIWTALLIELILAAAQFMHLTIFSRNNPGIEISLPSDYLGTGGFYIFQVIGLVLYTVAVYLIARWSATKLLSKVLTLIFLGGAIELSAYVMMQTSFGNGVIFSFMDKIVAASIGLMIYNYTDRKVASEPHRT